MCYPTTGRYASAPVCNIVPVRTCNKAPGNTPSKVANTVYKTVVDVKIIQDCSNTVRTTCTQQSVHQSHSSAVVANHGTVSVGSAVGAGFLDMLQVLCLALLLHLE